MQKHELVERELARTLKEMAAEEPLSAITVTALAGRCGISRGTFYHHFIDIFDLIAWIFDHDIIVPLQTCLREQPRTSWPTITEYCLEKMYENRSFYCQAVQMKGQNNLCDHMQEKNLESWHLLISRYLQETGQSYDEKELDFMLEFISYSICSMTIRWAENGMQLSPKEMAHMDDVARWGMYGTIAAANKE